jgi:DNA sulfur modification protein DndC
MSKQEEKYKQEADLLKKSCKQEPKDVELNQDLLALQKTKTLMIRKRGLQADIDNRLNQFIVELKNPVYMN